MKTRQPYLAFSLLALLSACSTGLHINTPPLPHTQNYLSKKDAIPLHQQMELGKQIDASWWRLFGSGTLDHLIQQSLKTNYTLASARNTLMQAREAVKAEQGIAYPQVSLGFLAGRQKYGAAMFGPSNFNIPPFNYYEAGPSVTWTPDLFGEDHYKMDREQAFARYQLHQLKALDLAVAGNTLSTAIDLACAHTEIAVLKKMKTGDKETLALIRHAYHNGSATRLDILSARNRLINDQVLLPPIEQRLSLDRHMLSILAGKTPSRWTPIKLDLHDIKLPKALPVSLPSKLIRTRPDILAAQDSLDAAGATLGIASARLYPQITLTADMMQEALTPAGLFKGASSAWSLAAGLSAPIFNGGTLHAEKKEAEDAYQAALAEYQQTILFAFKQVADNLTALAHDEEETVLMNQAVQMAKTSVRLAMVNYQAGAIGLLNLQKKQRALNQARLNQIRSINQQDLDCIRLFVSLGAGKD